MAFYKAVTQLDTAKIRQGQHLEVARELSIAQFISYYLENGRLTDTKKYRLLSIEPLYADQTHTYFGRMSTNYLVDFIKVDTRDLAGVDYTRLNGDTLRKRFIAEIVPEGDKQDARRKEKQCISLYYNPKFKYEYLKGQNQIRVTYDWKVSCEFVFRIVDKHYLARYNLATGRFE